MTAPFNYGNKMPDGQYEHHPALGPHKRAPMCRILPLRWVYIHRYGQSPCRKQTMCPLEVAETLAADPGFYKSTFCVGCQGYFPLKEFVWWEDGHSLDASLPRGVTPAFSI